MPSSAVLTDRNISALAADATGHLWVGYFDRGLDLLDSENRPSPARRRRARVLRESHLSGCEDRRVDVATANGLVRFDDPATSSRS